MAAAPVVEGYGTARPAGEPDSAAAPGLTLQVLGVDPLSEGPFRAYLAARGAGRGDDSGGGGEIAP